MSYFKKWWFSRYTVLNVTFGIALSELQFRFIVLDYGIDLSIRLPSSLDRVNLINWITKGLFYLLLKAFGNPDDIAFCKTWVLSEHKRLEVEVANVRDLLSLDYHWTAHWDHCGHWTRFALAGLELSANFYDRRHWNHEEDTYH